MTRLPWLTKFARLSMPRDLSHCYVLGRMGVATSLDIWPLLWDSRRSARAGSLRLEKLKLIRKFPRHDPSHPAWYSLASKRAAEWVASEMECDTSELRVVSGIRRMNLEAVRVRNRLWVSLVLACRETADMELLLFRPEFELRRMKKREVSIVPDAQIVDRKSTRLNSSHSSTSRMPSSA